MLKNSLKRHIHDSCMDVYLKTGKEFFRESVNNLIQRNNKMKSVSEDFIYYKGTQYFFAANPGSPNFGIGYARRNNEKGSLHPELYSRMDELLSFRRELLDEAEKVSNYIKWVLTEFHPVETAHYILPTVFSTTLGEYNLIKPLFSKEEFFSLLKPHQLETIEKMNNIIYRRMMLNTLY